MMRETGSFEFGKYVIEFTVVRRERRTLEIAVEPDTSVVVAAPADVSLHEIELKLKKRANWIRKQQVFFVQFLPRTPARLFVPGETHLYLGRQYRLKVAFSERSSVKLIRGFFQVESDAPDLPERTREIVEAWYRRHAKVKFAERLEVSLKRFPDPAAFQPKELQVRHLKQRWGSMSPSGRLLLNRRLVEAPTEAIDYVITHELCHITAPHHGTEFFVLMDEVMPDWPKRKRRLERFLA